MGQTVVVAAEDAMLCRPHCKGACNITLCDNGPGTADTVRIDLSRIKVLAVEDSDVRERLNSHEEWTPTDADQQADLAHLPAQTCEELPAREEVEEQEEAIWQEMDEQALIAEASAWKRRIVDTAGNGVDDAEHQGGRFSVQAVPRHAPRPFD